MKKKDISDFYPQVREFYQELLETMSDEELAGIELYKFMIYRIMQKYRIKNEGNFLKGEVVYDHQTARKENPFVSYFYRGKKSSKRLAGMLWKIEGQIEEGYLRILDPKNHPKGYIRAKEIFGNVKGKRSFNNLWDEIEDLILNEEDPKRHSRRLQRKFHKPKEMIFEKEKGVPGSKSLIDVISEPFNKMDPEEFRREKELNKSLKSQKPLEARRIKERPKPFDKFNVSLVLAAKEKKIIDNREFRVLKFRYNLECQGTKSLRLIAGWLGISHTTVRNIENRAIKKLEENINLLKKISVKKLNRQETTKEKYKKMYGYYPLD